MNQWAGRCLAPPPRPLLDDVGTGGTVAVGMAVIVGVVSGSARMFDAEPITGGVAVASAEATAADIAPACAELIVFVGETLPDVAGTAMVPIAVVGLVFTVAVGSAALVVALGIGSSVTESEGSGAVEVATVGACSLGAASLNHLSAKIPTPSITAARTKSTKKVTAMIPPVELRCRGGGATAITGAGAWLGDDRSGAGRGATAT